MRKIGMKKNGDIKNWDEKMFRQQFRKSKVDKGVKMNKNLEKSWLKKGLLELTHTRAKKMLYFLSKLGQITIDLQF